MAICTIFWGTDYYVMYRQRTQSVLYIDRAARLCTLCTNKSIGDEHHYLFECSFFQKERMKFLEPRLMQHPIEGRMARVFDTEDVKQLTKIALFIGKIIETFLLTRVPQTHLPTNLVIQNNKTSHPFSMVVLK